MDHAPLRRRFLKVAAASCVSTLAGSALPESFAACGAMQPTANPKSQRFTLGFSLYGMNSLPIAEAITACAKIGYSDIEPALMPGYSADPEKLSKPRRAELCRLIAEQGLRVSAVMENLPALAPVEQRQTYLDRIARAAELAHDLGAAGSGTKSADDAGGKAASAPIMETVLGGKPEEWNMVRGRILDTLKLWAIAGEKHHLVIAVKAHVANALHTPADLKAAVREIGSPYLKAAYDFSHFERQGMELEASFREVADETIFIHVKDGRGIPPKFQFLLPGEGTTDYGAMFRMLDLHHYRGSVTVEVSGMISKQTGYDPIAAAEKCYRHLSKFLTDTKG